jgi:hypothetical protein
LVVVRRCVIGVLGEGLIACVPRLRLLGQTHLHGVMTTVILTIVRFLEVAGVLLIGVICL